MKALVTGSDGFLGRHLCPELEKAGYEVDRVPSRLEGWFATLTSLSYRYDVVYHLAANILDVDARFKAGVNIYHDIGLDFRMAQYIQDHPPKCYVYPSSCAVDNLEDPYAWVKLTGERFCHALYKTGVEVVILRPFSGYGSDQSTDYPFRAILERVLRGDDPVVVWGDGTQVRDWVHVDDLVRALLLAPDSFPRDIPVELGTGVATSMRELALMMANEVAHRSESGEFQFVPRVKCDSSKETSSPRRVAKTSPALAHGWKSAIPLEEGIARAVTELQEQDDGTPGGKT